MNSPKTSENKPEKEKTKETPGKTKNVDEAINCSICSIRFSKKDASKHKTWCESFAGEIGSSIPEKSAHGFVDSKRMLFSTIFNEFIPSKEFQTLPFSRLRDRMIFLNPTTMRDSGLKIGDHVLMAISASDGSKSPTTAIVWPSSTVPLFSVGIPKKTPSSARRSSKMIKRYCGIARISNIKTADHLRLISDSDSTKFHHADDFLRFCHSYLNGTCAKEPEDIIRIPYFGQSYVFEISSDINDGLGNNSIEKSSLLVDRFSALGLDETDDFTPEDLDENGPIASTPNRTHSIENGTPTSSTHGKASFIQVPRFDTDQRFMLITDTTKIILETSTGSLR